MCPDCLGLRFRQPTADFGPGHSENDHLEPGPMEEFSLPEDVTALNDEELDDLLEGAVRAFDAKAGSATVTSDDLDDQRISHPSVTARRTTLRAPNGPHSRSTSRTRRQSE